MQIHDGELPPARQLARTGKELSREARVRLDWMDFYHRCRNVARTCRHFGISRQTFYRWQRRYDPHNLSTLEARSHRPHRRRQPTGLHLSPIASRLCVNAIPVGARTSSPSYCASSTCRFPPPWWAAS